MQGYGGRRKRKQIERRAHGFWKRKFAQYRKIALNDHSRRSDDIDLLSALGEDGWELVTIAPNNIAYLKRAITDDHAATSSGEEDERPTEVKAKYRDPVTGNTWSGRGRMATWLKRKQDAGEDIEKYRV